MGCVSSAPKEAKDDPAKAEAKAKAKADKEAAKAAAAAETKNTAKLVLIGPGESGKSTIFKQMKIIEGREGRQGISEEERRGFTSIVRVNVLSQFKLLLQICKEENIPFPKQDAVENIFSGEDIPEWKPEFADILKDAWADPTVKKLFSDRDSFTSDGLPYLLDNIDRIKLADYVPTEQDLLRVRIRTSGYTQATFQYKNIDFNVVDVGGQRPERRKWMECLNGVTAVIFCAPLSEFDQTLREDRTKPRMQETLLIFEELSTYTLKQIPIILLLNKLDLFKQKITAGKSIKIFFKDYNGAEQWEPAANYIKQAFISKAPDTAEIYPHFCTAVDTDNVNLIWKDTREIILSRLLSSPVGLTAMYGVSVV